MTPIKRASHNWSRGSVGGRPRGRLPLLISDEDDPCDWTSSSCRSATICCANEAEGGFVGGMHALGCTGMSAVLCRAGNPFCYHTILMKGFSSICSVLASRFLI